uniref:Uncharacterized protein n=1 Tax=Romanomermis culicivorax TaxID=13658 RepID=A0A915KSQ5_ROMCU
MKNNNTEKGFVPDDDIMNKIELMYSSCGTDVFVCQCPATLYFESEQSPVINERPSSSSDDWSLNSSGVIGTPTVEKSSPAYQSDDVGGGDYYMGKNWTFVATGVPTLVYDKGTSFCRRRKKLQLVLANCRTGFLIFAQNITDRSYYRKTEDLFHTFVLDIVDKFDQKNPIRHRSSYRSAGLRFDRIESAQEFFEQIQNFEYKLLNFAANFVKFDRPKTAQMKNENIKRTMSIGGSFGRKSAKKSQNYQSAGIEQQFDKTLTLSNKKRDRNDQICCRFINKSDISEPVLFKHITSVKIEDSFDY